MTEAGTTATDQPVADHIPQPPPPRPPRKQANWTALGIAFEATRARRGMSMRKAATEMRMPASTITKLRNGGTLSADGLARLLAWLYPRNVPWWVTSGTPTHGEENDDA